MTGGDGGANDGNLNFFAYINTTSLFDEIRFSSASTTSQSEDFWAFDDMTIGSLEQVSTVPEPSTVALLGAGVTALALVRRRKLG